MGPGVGLAVGAAEVGLAVGESVFQSQVCPAELQSPSLQWWVCAHPHVCWLPGSAKQMPYCETSQPWLPWLQACRVGDHVGETVGIAVGIEVVGATVVGATVVGAPVIGALVVGAGVVGEPPRVSSGQSEFESVQTGVHVCKQ